MALMQVNPNQKEKKTPLETIGTVANIAASIGSASSNIKDLFAKAKIANTKIGGAK